MGRAEEQLTCANLASTASVVPVATAKIASQFRTTLMLPLYFERIFFARSAVLAEFAAKVGSVWIEAIAVGRITFMPTKKLTVCELSDLFRHWVCSSKYSKKNGRTSKRGDL